MVRRLRPDPVGLGELTGPPGAPLPPLSAPTLRGLLGRGFLLREVKFCKTLSWIHEFMNPPLMTQPEQTPAEERHLRLNEVLNVLLALCSNISIVNVERARCQVLSQEGEGEEGIQN